MQATNNDRRANLMGQIDAELRRVFGDGYSTHEAEADDEQPMIRLGYLDPETGAGFPVGDYDLDRAAGLLASLKGEPDGAGVGESGDADVFSRLPRANREF